MELQASPQVVPADGTLHETLDGSRRVFGKKVWKTVGEFLKEIGVLEVILSKQRSSFL